MTRETVRDTPQYFIMSMSGNGAKPGLRQLSDYPHPYPSIRDLQKEIIRYGVRRRVLLLNMQEMPFSYDSPLAGRKRMLRGPSHDAPQDDLD